MIYIKRNIWKLFTFTMLMGLLILTYVLYSLWGQIHLKYKLEQENIARIAANSTTAMLSQYEVTLDILGEYLIKDDAYKNSSKSKKILKKLLKANPSIAGFGLVNPQGQLYVTSIDKSVDKLPNLLEKEETRESFNRALNKDTMVLGRTYFHNTLNTYIIPIRKVIKDENLNILAVMTAGIKVNNWHLTMISKEEKIAKYKSILVRDFDKYLQLVPRSSKYKKRQYETKLPEKYIDNIIKLIEAKKNLTIQKIKVQELITTVRYESFIGGEYILSSLMFVPKYNLWSIVQIKYKTILEEFYKKTMPIIIFFLSIGTVMFFLFSQLNKVARKNRKELEYQAEHDYLTELNNRYFLSKKFDYSELSQPFALIVLNIDNFKNINENYGHKYGDTILKKIAKRLLKIKKDDDVLVRYSGDEFLFIRYNLDRKDTPKLAEEIIKSLNEPYKLKEFSIVLGVSLGITGYPSDGKDFEEIKKYADIALQEVKKKKNSYMFFEDSIKQKYLRHSQIEHELKKALDNNEIYMVYQPQIKSDGTLYGVEALVRWENSKLGFIPPDEFISIAESTGIMVKLGQYIINTSLKEISEIQKQSDKQFQLSINISIKQFIEPDFYKNLLSSIQVTNFDHSMVTLEVTENLFIEDLDEILALLEKLRKRDIKISLDDFGTGYSSLSLLKQLPINELKIDKSFIDDIEHDEDAVKMVRGIILIGKQLNMELLAEGVEKVEQRDMLYTYGCDLFQGYYFSKPLKKEALLDFL